MYKLLVWAIALAVVNAGDYSRDIVQLGKDDFDQVLNDGVPWLIDFYGTYCPACVDFIPELNQLARELKAENIKTGAINSDEAFLLSSKYNIEYLPTFILFVPGEYAPYKYNPMAERTGRALKAFIHQKLAGRTFDGSLAKKPSESTDFNNFDFSLPEGPDFSGSSNKKSRGQQNRQQPARQQSSSGSSAGNIVELDKRSFKQNLKKPSEPWVVKVYGNHCPACVDFNPEYKNLANEFAGRVKFGSINSDDRKMQKYIFKWDIQYLPSVLLFKPGQRKPVMYNPMADRTSSAIGAWINQQLSGAGASSGGRGGRGGRRRNRSGGNSGSSGRSYTTPGGTQVTIQQEGSGREAQSGDTVYMYYEGKLQSNGKMFDSCTSGKPFSFRLDTRQVIPGWDEAIQGMKIGGRRTLVIPPDQAYGRYGSGPIPPNATLVFKIELKDIA